MESVNGSMTQTEYINLNNQIFKLQSEHDFDGIDNSAEIERLKMQIEIANDE